MDINLTIPDQSFLGANLFEVQFIATFSGMILLFLIEGFVPRRATKENQACRWLSNIGLIVINHFLIIAYSFLISGLVSVIQFSSPILQYFDISNLLLFVIILLVMEFVTYWTHRAFHKIPLLWRLHAAHHTDTEFDVTTSHRHHPFDLMLNTLILTPIVFALGAPTIVLVLYNLIHITFSLLSHSNIAIPNKLDNFLRLLVVTPDFHRMHHSSDRQYTDSNYGAIVPWFDYLFKTATCLPYNELPQMDLGLEVLRASKDNRLDKILITPFILSKSTRSTSL